MKSCIVLGVLPVALMALARPKEAQYTDRYDNLDLNKILGSRRLLVPYIKYILDQGKCAPDAKELKYWNELTSKYDPERKFTAK